MNETEQYRFRQTLDTELSGLSLSPARKRLLCSRAKGETEMKKKLSLVPVAAIVLILVLTGAALAASGAFDALKALWSDSFRRMNTTGAADPIDAADVPAYLESFEEAYEGQKEDLVLSTVPGEGDLSLNDAVSIARNTIFEKFGTPADELDAMGVYPEFLKTPYLDLPDEWHFYFTPRTDVNIDEDCDYPAPGEYRVWITSPSGEVTDCFWYNDDFWPDYARRTWESGSREYVYEEARRGGFLKMAPEDRQTFLVLFEAAGMDTSVFNTGTEERLRSMETELNFLEPEKDLLGSDDPLLPVALQALGDRTGLTEADLRDCCFIACRSLYPSGTEDICFCYNYCIEARKGAGMCEGFGVSYASRLGLFMVRIDPAAQEAIGVTHIDRDPDGARADDPAKLLGRRNWTKDDLPEYRAMLEELRQLDEACRTCALTQVQAENEADRVMLRYGGDSAFYSADRPEQPDGEMTFAQWLYQNGLTEEMISEAGIAYITEHSAYTRQQLAGAVFLPGTMSDDIEHPDAHHPTLLVQLTHGGTKTEWYLQFDMDLQVTYCDESEGIAGENG